MPHKRPISSREDNDIALVINHTQMKIRLHTTAPRAANYRVRLTPAGELEVCERCYGTSWCACVTNTGLRDPVRTIILNFLRGRDDHRFYFLFENEITPLLNRCDDRPPTLR